jgi:hypothetical protein
MSDRFLEQQNNHKFCAQLSMEMIRGALNMKTTEFVMETADSPMTQQGSLVETTNVENAHNFFGIKGTVRFEFIPQGQTVNQAHYKEILKRLHEALLTKRPELWSNDWILLHNNAPAHKVLSVEQFVAQESITEMGYTSCSYFLDLAPNNFVCCEDQRWTELIQDHV